MLGFINLGIKCFDRKNPTNKTILIEIANPEHSLKGIFLFITYIYEL